MRDISIHINKGAYSKVRSQTLTANMYSKYSELWIQGKTSNPKLFKVLFQLYDKDHIYNRAQSFTLLKEGLRQDFTLGFFLDGDLPSKKKGFDP